ncbi:MAG TPA: protein kinase, partial [Pyrinomonadaceae bacterium]|nr:protein kinase [Pyrinomonadaceae bacterium]
KLRHYTILSKIGAGGMGEVFLALDTKLDRRVAIKFLNQEFGRDPEKLKRFIQEAKAASALNHPNILTVYEIGEVDGQNYIATELIDGHTLREELRQKQPLPLNQILTIAVQVAEALAAAHAAGIIHRDIKPENIMIRRDGYAKVLDFGLAKLSDKLGDGVRGREGDDLDTGKQGSGHEGETLIAASPRLPLGASLNPVTSPGVVMGTVFYMSPEQARGNPTDTRTDIWSLGAVLYEIISGRVPFSGETVNHTMVAILEKEPALLEKVPAELQRIVRKALTKDVDMRYQSVRDLLIDLKNLRRELDIKREIERSIVSNREATTDAFAESETRAYPIDSAVGTRSAEVKPTHASNSTSSLEYAVNKAKSHKVATAIVAFVLLGVLTIVGYFVFASKRINSADQINSIAVMPFVNASGKQDVEYLSDGLTDSLVFRFSQLPNVRVSPTSSVMRFKGTTKDVTVIAKELDVDAVLTGRLMQVGDSLSISVQLIDARTQKLIWAEQYDRKLADLLATQREIATTLTQKMQLRLRGDERGITKKYTSSSEAYQLYLKGRYHWSRRTKDDLDKAIDSYKKAIELDPNFALAYAAIAEAYNSMGKNPDVAPKDCIPLAKAAAMRALEIDPLLPEAHSALGDSLAIYDWNWAESEREFKKSFELDPNIAYTHVAYALARVSVTGNVDALVNQLERAAELEPLSMINNAVLISAYVYARRYDKALVQGRSAYELDPSFPLIRHWLGMALVENGKYDEAIALSRQSPPDSPFGWVSVVVIAYADAKQGKRTEALQQISLLRELGKTRYVRSYYLAGIYAALGDKDQAFAELERSVADRDCYLGRISVDPMMDPLRSDPRFKAILKTMNLPT